MTHVHLCLCHCFVGFFSKHTAEAAGNAKALVLQVTLYCASSDTLYYSSSADQS